MTLVSPQAVVGPAFNSATYAYTSTLIYTMSSFQVTPTPLSMTASISFTWNGGSSTPIGNGAQQNGLPVITGDNVLVFMVVSEDGTAVNTYTWTITRTPPPPPTILSATGGTLSAVVSFTAVAGLTYTVLSAAGVLVAGPSSTSPITVMGLAAGTTYNFTVVASSVSAGPSVPSSVIIVTTT